MWRCCLPPCTQLKDLIHPDESPMYTLYCYRFSCRSVQQCFWESIAKLVDGFWILTTLFAAFRNCRSVRSNFTAQAHLCFPLSDDPVNRETSQGKPGKYHTWVGRQKCDGQKSPKSVFTGFANELPKASRKSKTTEIPFATENGNLSFFKWFHFIFRHEVKQNPLGLAMRVLAQIHNIVHFIGFLISSS